MLTVSEALETILAHTVPLPAVRRPLLSSRGLVLAEDVRADIASPPFDNSAVDGFAVRAVDTRGASAERPVVLKTIGTIGAGEAPPVTLSELTCAKLFTGAPVPEGADAVVMVEDARETPYGIFILKEAKPGDHVRYAGEDIRRGEIVATSGTLVGPAEVAVLAAMGRVELPVVRPPRVAILTTGDEVIDISFAPAPGQIRDSNRYALSALVEESGAEIHTSRHLPDDPRAIARALRSSSGLTGSSAADVILTSGGVSVGERDYVRPALEKLGELIFWRVSVKPGKPLVFGRIGRSLFFGLPGNPVSAMVTFELFVRPALWKMAGRTTLDRLRVTARLLEPVPHTPGREEYVRARVVWSPQGFVASAEEAQGSGMLRSMLGVNALLVIPAESAGLRAGEPVTAILLSPPAAARG